MSKSHESISALKATIQSLRQRVKDLESVRCNVPDDSLKLQILDGSPFTMWACDRNFLIRVWNKKCEEIYGFSQEEAIGKSFVELFVDGPEREQAKKDCLEIIDYGKRCENFLAYDNDRHGLRRIMLTNCFRIWDDVTLQYLQAEVACLVDDVLAESRVKHQTLREVGRELMGSRKQEINARKGELNARVGAASQAAHYEWKKRLDEMEKFSAEDLGKSPQSREMQTRFEQIRRRLQAIKDSPPLLHQRIGSATTVEQLDALEEEVKAYEALQADIDT